MPGVENPTDYIPIHTSDRIQFKKCRRRWNWNSPSRENLVPKRARSGVIFPLWFGTGVHAAIEWYYQNRDYSDDGIYPQEYFEDWYNEETSNLLELNTDWYMQNEEEFINHFELGMGMLTNYVTFAREHDNFEVIKTEYDFAVPVGHPENPLHMYDTRSGKMLPVMYKGRQDLIIRELEHGTYGIMDHKTATAIGEDYFEKLDMDEQCTSYLWAARFDNELLELTGGKYPQFVYYNTLRKVAPAPPTVTYPDSPQPKLSIARATESTTFDQWNKALDDMQLRGTPWHLGERVQDYEKYLKEVGWDQFFVRKHVARNEHEILNIAMQIELEAKDMLDLPSIYPNPSSDWYCMKCPFRAPCLATNDGSDVDYMLEENYEPNTDR